LIVIFFINIIVIINIAIPNTNNFLTDIVNNILFPGILSLLRRGVNKIISFCANNEEIQDHDLSPHRDTISEEGEEGEGERERQQWDRSVDANQVSHIDEFYHLYFNFDDISFYF
jgi:hypothetical protein